jgi:hypothetical protein
VIGGAARGDVAPGQQRADAGDDANRRDNDDKFASRCLRSSLVIVCSSS